VSPLDRVRGPNLGSGDYGDLELQSNSPCINAGSTADVPAGTIEDLAENPRVHDTIVDIGALEFQGTGLPAVASLTLSYSGSAVNGLTVTFNETLDGGTITLYGPDGTPVVLNGSTSGSDSFAFSFSSLPAGQYVLAVNPTADSLSGGTEYFVFDSA
jgi:hypothetical protein